MILGKTLGLFIITAIAEIRVLSPLSLVQEGRISLAFGARRDRPRAVRLASHASPTDAGRVYAAYGGVYVAVAFLWLWWVDGVALTRWDVAGVAVVLVGMGIIVWGGWQT